MAKLILSKGRFSLQVNRNSDLFISLARSITYQQLSGQAAATIYGRFEKLFKGAKPVAGQAVNFSVEKLRSVGLSNNKALSIIDLAKHSCADSLPNARKMSTLGNEEIIENLCRVRGIGPWTVQMHLIFSLGRPDVMPTTDLGIQKGVQLTYGLAELPKPKQVLAVTRHLAPYRSVASWYFWRAVDD